MVNNPILLWFIFLVRIAERISVNRKFSVYLLKILSSTWQSGGNGNQGIRELLKRYFNTLLIGISALKDDYNEIVVTLQQLLIIHKHMLLRLI